MNKLYSKSLLTTESIVEDVSSSSSRNQPRARGPPRNKPLSSRAKNQGSRKPNNNLHEDSMERILGDIPKSSLKVIDLSKEEEPENDFVDNQRKSKLKQQGSGIGIIDFSKIHLKKKEKKPETSHPTHSIIDKDIEQKLRDNLLVGLKHINGSKAAPDIVRNKSKIFEKSDTPKPRSNNGSFKKQVKSTPTDSNDKPVSSFKNPPLKNFVTVTTKDLSTKRGSFRTQVKSTPTNSEDKPVSSFDKPSPKNLVKSDEFLSNKNSKLKQTPSFTIDVPVLKQSQSVHKPVPNPKVKRDLSKNKSLTAETNSILNYSVRTLGNNLSVATNELTSHLSNDRKDRTGRPGFTSDKIEKLEKRTTSLENSVITLYAAITNSTKKMEKLQQRVDTLEEENKKREAK